MDGGLPVLTGSAQNAEDDVEVHIGKLGPAGCTICRLGIRGAVPAAKGFEISVVERLHAKTQTIATAGAKSVKLLRVSRGRVRFKGDFGFRSNPKSCCGSVEYLLHLHRVKQAGRTAPQEHRLQRSAVRQRLPGAHLGTDRLNVAVIQGRVPSQNSESAIGAALWTE